ncbi:hypothetical protein ACFFJY_09255 [Fictibacillus aquaticus]|uniref:ArpU family transcriptional regulator n=1 Tax=Fictibacillus aquaticus TaxID=2021314 RepID=A0A235FBZ4_9BACL|nr:hypothetical protein [Fictibacillus aquaticus]OYD58463.1 hypothetical protein CGZ90_00750 [Fictibacillus aquaticus]
MGQMELIDRTLSKRAKREVMRLMRSYGTLEAIIKSMSVDLPEQSMTVNYNPSEAQRSNQFNSGVENIVVMRDSLLQKKIQKEKLDIIYESVHDDQRKMWDLRFIQDYTDEQTMIQMNLTTNRKKYFKEKYELMGMIADAFYLW